MLSSRSRLGNVVFHLLLRLCKLLLQLVQRVAPIDEESAVGRTSERKREWGREREWEREWERGMRVGERRGMGRLARHCVGNGEKVCAVCCMCCMCCVCCVYVLCCVLRHCTV